MTNKVKKNNNNKFNVSKILDNKLYIVVSILVLFMLILIVGLSVSDKEVLSKNPQENSKASFIELKDNIQLKVANMMLDGTVTDEQSMEGKIEEINNILAKEQWYKLEINCNIELDGTWELDKNGMLKFKFDSKSVEPSWVNDTDIVEYIIKN